MTGHLYCLAASLHFPPVLWRLKGIPQAQPAGRFESVKTSDIDLWISRGEMVVSLIFLLIPYIISYIWSLSHQM